MGQAEAPGPWRPPAETPDSTHCSHPPRDQDFYVLLPSPARAATPHPEQPLTQPFPHDSTPGLKFMLPSPTWTPTQNESPAPAEPLLTNRIPTRTPHHKAGGGHTRLPVSPPLLGPLNPGDPTPTQSHKADPRRRPDAGLGDPTLRAATRIHDKDPAPTLWRSTWNADPLHRPDPGLGAPTLKLQRGPPTPMPSPPRGPDPKALDPGHGREPGLRGSNPQPATRTHNKDPNTDPTPNSGSRPSTQDAGPQHRPDPGLRSSGSSTQDADPTPDSGPQASGPRPAMRTRPRTPDPDRQPATWTHNIDLSPDSGP